MSTDSLKVVLETIKGKKALAEADPGHDPHSKRTRMGHIKRAKEDLVDLYYQYRQEVKERALFILVTGDEAEKFAKSAEKSFNCFSLDAELMYKELLDKVPKQLKVNTTASSSMFDHLLVHFEDRAKQIDIIGFPMLVFEQKYKKVLQSEEEALQLVKQAMGDKIGHEVIALDAIEKISIKAVNQDFSGKVAPIVLYSNDGKFVTEVMKGIRRSVTNKVYMVSAGSTQEETENLSFDSIKKVTKSSVENSLKKIKESLK